MNAVIHLDHDDMRKILNGEEIIIPALASLKNSQNIILKCDSYERWTGSKEGTSMKYWVAHLKNGQRLVFGKRAGYVEVYQDELCYAFMTCKNGDVVGIIPNESLLWAERVEEKE